MIKDINIYNLTCELIKTEKELNEGLILTHDIHNSKNILKSILSKWFFNKIEIIDNKIKILLGDGKFNIKSYMEFLILVNNLGYYISVIEVVNDMNMNKIIKPGDFKKEYLKDHILNNFISYDITLEPKYDIKHKLKTNTLYHVTENKYLDKINKKGLITKSNNTKGYYPERIYFVYSIQDAEEYIKSKSFYYLTNMDKEKQPNKSKFKEIEFTILKIKLPENSDIIFFEDPNFKGKGIYTYENIPSNLIYTK